MIGGQHRLNQLRDAAREVAQALGYDRQFKRLDELIGALLGTHSARRLTAGQAIARAAGRPYDPLRLPIFDSLHGALNSSVLPDIPDPADRGAARESLAFFEDYFSNYIEGTTFTVDEAEDILFRGRIIENRSEDSHDVLGTYMAAVDPPWRDRAPQSADDFLHWLRSVNALVMQEHSAKRPGEWKDRPNQAGSTSFVAPELVPGTLREGFERIRGLAHPLARAIMTIPTVYREDYLLPLKALSHHQQAEPPIRSMTRIQRWSAAFDYSMPRPALRDAMARCNAFQEDLRNYRLLFPEA